MTLPSIPGFEQFAMGLQDFCYSDRVNHSLFCGLHEVTDETGEFSFFTRAGTLSCEHN